MSDQDSQDINQMMSETAGVDVAKPRKSKFVWVVLGCVVVGVGLGVFVYQRSTVPAPSIKPTPRPVATVAPPVASPVVTPSASSSASVTPSPVVPQINVVTPSASSSASPSASRAASPSPSASVTPTPTPNTSPRVAMPDTSQGTPVTGVFEVTVASVSLGLIFLMLGLFGLLAL